MRQPFQHIARVSIRWEYRIKHLLHYPITNNQRETLEKLHLFHSESRQAHRTRELKSLIGKQTKRQVQPVSDLVLILRPLSGKPKYGRDPESLEFHVMIPESATLRRASPRPGNVIPPGGIRILRNPGPWIRIDHHPAS